MSKKRRRQVQVGWSRVLTPSQQALWWEYLQGQVAAAVTDAEKVAACRTLLMCEILICTGLRELELVRLRVQDTPTVLGQNVIEVYRGKNNKDRTVPISKDLAAHIGDYIADIRPMTLPRWMRRGDIGKPLFYSRVKRPYTVKAGDRTRASSAIYRMIRRVGEAAGIRENKGVDLKRCHPHMMRHTFAVNALQVGLDIYTVQQLMGHSAIQTTAGYLHLVKFLELGEKLRFGPKEQG